MTSLTITEANIFHSGSSCTHELCPSLCKTLRKLTTGLSPTNGGEHNTHSTMNSIANFLREGLKFV